MKCKFKKGNRVIQSMESRNYHKNLKDVIGTVVVVTKIPRENIYVIIVDWDIGVSTSNFESELLLYSNTDDLSYICSICGKRHASKHKKSVCEDMCRCGKKDHKYSHRFIYGQGLYIQCDCGMYSECLLYFDSRNQVRLAKLYKLVVESKEFGDVIVPNNRKDKDHPGY